MNFRRKAAAAITRLLGSHVGPMATADDQMFRFEAGNKASMEFPAAMSPLPNGQEVGRPAKFHPAIPASAQARRLLPSTHPERHMKPLFSLFVLFCLGLSPAFAQDNTASRDQTGLDKFHVSMTKTEAKALGAKPDGKGQMKGKINWDDEDWKVQLTFEGEGANLVALTSEVSNGKMSQVLQDMQDRSYVPLYISRESKGKEKNSDLMDLAAKGKTAEQRSEVMDNEISAYADQDDGKILIMFGPVAMLEQLSDTVRKKGDEDAAVAGFSQTVIYSLSLDKKTDSINVISATFGEISK